LSDEHYVVVYAFAPQGVVVGDPAAGIATLSVQTFAQSWSRNLLLLLPVSGAAATPAAAKPPTGPDMTEEPSFSTLQLNEYIDHLRAGNRGAADALLRRVCDRLERLARRMLKNFPAVKRWADTGDVLQSALMRLLRSLEAIRPESTRDFFNLAAVHIRRELLDLARSFRRRRDQVGLLEPGDDSAAPAVVPEAAVDQDLDLWSAFHERVEQLPADEREVASLTFYHGWTQVQIAELLGVDERTVRRRWHAACWKLSQALGGRLPET
jgi:RNA polymerase sigma-70 factor (ECF subfamily)